MHLSSHVGYIEDVQPEWASFPGQKPADGCHFLTENLRMGYNLNKTYCSSVNFGSCSIVKYV